MSLAENERARIGDNIRDPLDDEIARWCEQFGAELDERGQEAARATVTNEEEAGRAAALVKVFMEIGKAVDAKRTELKAPYLAAGKRIDASFSTLVDAADKAKKKMLGMIDGFMREQHRIAEEARLRAEKEARDKAAAAAKAEAEGRISEAARLQSQADAATEVAENIEAPTQVRSSYGQVASTRAVWKFQIMDAKKLPKEVTQHPKVREAIETVIAQMVRGGTREMTGVKIYETQSTVVR